MNYCDHGHETRGEIRRLPLGMDPHHGALLVCHAHYQQEMAYRRERGRETGMDKWTFPAWATLATDQPGA